VRPTDPAFPRPASVDQRSGTLPDGDNHLADQVGMCVRDYIAMHMLTALALHSGGELTDKWLALRAYALADEFIRHSVAPAQRPQPQPIVIEEGDTA
jgi:hypothetical protein